MIARSVEREEEATPPPSSTSNGPARVAENHPLTTAAENPGRTRRQRPLDLLGEELSPDKLRTTRPRARLDCHKTYRQPRRQQGRPKEELDPSSPYRILPRLQKPLDVIRWERSLGKSGLDSHQTRT